MLEEEFRVAAHSIPQCPSAVRACGHQRREGKDSMRDVDEIRNLQRILDWTKRHARVHMKRGPWKSNLSDRRAEDHELKYQSASMIATRPSFFKTRSTWRLFEQKRGESVSFWMEPHEWPWLDLQGEPRRDQHKH